MDNRRPLTEPEYGPCTRRFPEVSGDYWLEIAVKMAKLAFLYRDACVNGDGDLNDADVQMANRLTGGELRIPGAKP
jgi:hypothetical protein